MKLAAPLAALAALLLAGPAGASRLLRRARDDGSKRAITQVVNLLEEMLEKSQAEGVKERELFAKHKCYCDSNEEEKSATVARLTEEIGILESRIESTQASTAILSQEVAELEKKLEENAEELQAATTLRGNENQAFVAKDGDLRQAIGQMEAALQQLSNIGADQTLGADASHEQFMAGHGVGLVALRGAVQQALKAATAFDATPKQEKTIDAFLQEKTIDAFLQAPFTAAYSSQSGEVVGILKQMIETFQANVDEATQVEQVAATAYEKLKETLEGAAKTMGEARDEKQGLLSANDGGLGTMKEQLSTAETERTDASQFLERLGDICTTKTKEYESRVQLRTSEEAAISQAVAILNSDAAFATFGKVAATSSGGTGPAAFFQRAAVRRVAAAAPSVSERRQQARELLRRAAHGRRSKVLSRVVGLLEAENPFQVVLEEIEKMIALIAEEETNDQEKHDWCVSERQNKDAELESTNSQITTLEAQLGELHVAIEDPETGLIVTIKNTEDSLASCREDQKAQTEARTKENLVYQANIQTLVEAEDLLSKAIEVLKKYYEEAIASVDSMLQTKGREDPAPPETWGSEYTGQKEAGTGAIGMVEFILSETKKEEQAGHAAEDESQQSFEASMTTLKAQEAELGEILASKQLELSDKKEELLGKEADLKATVGVKEKVEAYLEDIKAGCDFIVNNLVSRKASRQEEKEALESASGLLKGTPAYQAAMATAHNETLGACVGTCAKDEGHVDCKACLAETSVPGYCAGHPGTPGC
mmetsp:Transcript_6969/g.19658  ORF Transcript_6969/g.19658 Transcript_6969/m.19658 type:complete len:769 (+) Transcript_6969:85-2391(+)